MSAPNEFNSDCRRVESGKLLGEYLLQKQIGAGGMGQVFRAEHRRMKRLVAVKILPAEIASRPTAVDRFYREVQAAARLTHPNIVTAYDAGEHDGVHFLVMELVDGIDLGAVLQHHGTLPVAEAVSYISQAALGLSYAHQHGIIHRDVKPGNLLLDKSGIVKVADLGLSRMNDTSGASDRDLTATGQVMGTVDYMSPEQAESTHHADARSDIYSLGCTLYRLLTGEPPYPAETIVSKLVAHRQQAVPKLSRRRPDVPPSLEEIFQRMVAKLPEHRFQTMSEVVTALAGCLVAEPASSTGGWPAADGKFGFLGNVPSSHSQELVVETARRADSPTQSSLAGEETRTSLFNSSSTRRRNGRRLPILVTAACGCLLAAGLATVLWFINRDPAAPAVKARRSNAAKVSKPGSPAPTPVRSTVQSVSQDLAPGVWHDALSWMKLEDDAVRGNWLLADRGYEGSGEYAALMVPAELPADYQLRARVTPLAGSTEISLVLPVGETHCKFVLHHDTTKASGVDYVSGLPPGDAKNPSSVSTPHIKSGVPYELTVKVQCAGDEATITAAMDGKPLVHWTGPQRDLSIHDSGTLPNPRCTGIVLGHVPSPRARLDRFEILSGGGALRILPPPNSQPERAAAEHFRALGAKLILRDGQDHLAFYYPSNPLPRRTHFTVWSLDIGGTKVQDRDLERLSELSDLRLLHLWGTAITDAGMKHVGKVHSLQHLPSAPDRVTDAGLESLSELTKLQHVNTGWSGAVTGQGIAALQGSAIHTAALNATVFDARAAMTVAAWPKLRHLSLEKVVLSAECLDILSGCSDLRYLNLSNAKVDTAALDRFRHRFPLCVVVGQGEQRRPPVPAGSIDLLAELNADRDAIISEWKLDADGLFSTGGNPLAIEIPYEPPAEYDLTLLLARSHGLRVGTVRIGLAGGGRQFDAVLDAEDGGKDDYLFWNAIESLDGLGGYHNDTRRNTTRNIQLWPTQLVCKVRAMGVQILCEGKLVTEYQGPFSRLSVNDWSDRVLPHSLGLYLYNSGSFRVRQMYLTPVDQTKPGRVSPGDISPEFKGIRLVRAMGGTAAVRFADGKTTSEWDFARLRSEPFALVRVEIPIPNRSLKELARIPSLEEVVLGEHGLSDNRLLDLYGLKQVKKLILAKKFLSESSIQNLRTALPDCEIAVR